MDNDFNIIAPRATGDPDNVVEVVCYMSQAFLSGGAENLPHAEMTVDWFHIVQTFAMALDEVRKKERREKGHLNALGWAVLKNLDNGNLMARQVAALQELVADQGATGDAWVIKEKLRWIQKAPRTRSRIHRPATAQADGEGPDHP